MSTSDPDRPADDTTPSPAASTPPPDDSPAAADAPPAEPAPADDTTPEPTAADPIADEPAAPSAEPAAPLVTEPAAPTAPSDTAAAVVAEPAAAEPPARVSLDTGRHAVVRPAPVPPEDPAIPAATAAPVGVAPVDPTLAAAAVAGATTPEPVASYGAITPEPDVDGRLFPDPNAPSSPSAGSRILGVLVGLILAPIGVAVLLLGESQILEAQVDGWDATTSVFGIVLVTLGLLLLGCVLLLGMWTAAVPITGGAVLTAVGSVYLYAPSIAREQTLTVLTSEGWHKTITQVTVAGTSGTVLAVGFLLLLAGLVISSARKRGVHLGEFRERHRA